MTRSTKQKTIYSKEYKMLAQKLKRARVKAGLTQVQTAKKLGRPQSYVSKVETGQYYMDIFELKRLARIYRKNINSFI